MFFMWKKFDLFTEHIAIWSRMFMNLTMITFQCCLLLKSYIQIPELVSLIDEIIYEILIALFASTFIFCLLAVVSTVIGFIKANK